MSDEKPRECEVSMESREWKEFINKNPHYPLLGCPPLDLVIYEKVRMIEYRAYEDLQRKLESLELIHTKSVKEAADKIAQLTDKLSVAKLHIIELIDAASKANDGHYDPECEIEEAKEALEKIK